MNPEPIHTGRCWRCRAVMFKIFEGDDGRLAVLAKFGTWVGDEPGRLPDGFVDTGGLRLERCKRGHKCWIDMFILRRDLGKGQRHSRW